MIAQWLRLVAAFIAAVFVCACSNSGDAALLAANAPSRATAQHANDPIRIGFEDLNGVAVDSSTHDVYVSSYKDGIRKMAPDGTITTLPDTNRAERVAVDSSTHDVYYRAGSWVNKVEPNGSKRVIVVGGLGAFAVDPVTHNLYVAFELRKSVTDHGIMKFAPNYITNYGIMKFAPNGATIGCVTGSDTGRPSVSPSTSTPPPPRGGVASTAA